ncbi:MAG TPA: PGPGW domain-containing protein [Candidatus Saccharimonadales bacterium]|nr:PGPGW domain-containing protein [Candidatus Saccharimonadales bacterium]
MSVLRLTRKILATIVGFGILSLGIVLSLPGIPGPGLLISILGLAILSTEYTWARNYLDKSKTQLKKFTDRYKEKISKL